MDKEGRIRDKVETRLGQILWNVKYGIETRHTDTPSVIKAILSIPELGYRKLPKDKPPLLSDEEILEASNKLDAAIGFKADYASEGQRVIARTQRDKDIEFYSRGKVK